MLATTHGGGRKAWDGGGLNLWRENNMMRKMYNVIMGIKLI